MKLSTIITPFIFKVLMSLLLYLTFWHGLHSSNQRNRKNTTAGRIEREGKHTMNHDQAPFFRVDDLPLLPCLTPINYISDFVVLK
jgi:hypothetical protein